MSRARFGWLLGLGLVLGLIAALVARVVPARRRELGSETPGPRPVAVPEPIAAPEAIAVPEAVEAAVALRRVPTTATTVTLPVLEELDDDVVIDLTDGAAWATPVDGECPEGFPIKAKLSSGIFHLPGMSAYGRTHPDRCYASTEDALLDGLRVAKR